MTMAVESIYDRLPSTVVSHNQPLNEYENARIVLFAAPYPKQTKKFRLYSEIVLEQKMREIVRERKDIDNFVELEHAHSATISIRNNDRIRVEVSNNGCFKLSDGTNREHRCICYLHGGVSNHFVDILEENCKLGRGEYIIIYYSRDNDHSIVHEVHIGPTIFIKTTVLPALQSSIIKHVFGQQSLWVFARHVPIDKILGIGRCLKVSDENMEEIEYRYPKNSTEQTYRIIKCWMQKGPPNIKCFAQALRDNELGTLAEVVESAFRRGIPMENSHFLQ